jgi:hypothetical protein
VSAPTDLAQQFSLSGVGLSHPVVVPLRVAREAGAGFFILGLSFPQCPEAPKFVSRGCRSFEAAATEAASFQSVSRYASSARSLRMRSMSCQPGSPGRLHCQNRHPLTLVPVIFTAASDGLARVAP